MLLTKINKMDDEIIKERRKKSVRIVKGIEFKDVPNNNKCIFLNYLKNYNFIDFFIV